jgi:hypothetical protein
VTLWELLEKKEGGEKLQDSGEESKCCQQVAARGSTGTGNVQFHAFKRKAGFGGD